MCSQLRSSGKVKLYMNGAADFKECKTWNFQNKFTVSSSLYLTWRLIGDMNLPPSGELWPRPQKIIKERELQWMGHTLRRESQNHARAALDFNPDTRNRGHLNISWKLTTKMEAAKEGMIWNQPCPQEYIAN